MDQNERDQQQGDESGGFERNKEDQGDLDRGMDRDRDEQLQREGNLGNERNRNEPDTERRPGGGRENLTP